MPNDAEVDCWVEEAGKRMKVERVGDNARITIYDIDGSSSVTATIAYWRWQRVLRIFWPPSEVIAEQKIPVPKSGTARPRKAKQ